MTKSFVTMAIHGLIVGTLYGVFSYAQAKTLHGSSHNARYYVIYQKDSDDTLCSGIREIYNSLLTSSGILNIPRQGAYAPNTRLPTTQFEVNDPKSFTSIGLVQPIPIVVNDASGMSAFLIDVFSDGIKRILAFTDTYPRNNQDMYTSVYVLKHSVIPTEDTLTHKTPFGATITYDLPSSIIHNVSPYSIEFRQTHPKILPSGFLMLTHWPNFEKSYLAYKSGYLNLPPSIDLMDNTSMRLFLYKNSYVIIANHYLIGSIGRNDDSVLYAYTIGRNGYVDRCYLELHH